MFPRDERNRNLVRNKRVKARQQNEAAGIQAVSPPTAAHEAPRRRINVDVLKRMMMRNKSEKEKNNNREKPVVVETQNPTAQSTQTVVTGILQRDPNRIPLREPTPPPKQITQPSISSVLPPVLQDLKITEEPMSPKPEEPMPPKEVPQYQILQRSQPAPKVTAVPYARRENRDPEYRANCRVALANQIAWDAKSPAEKQLQWERMVKVEFEKEFERLENERRRKQIQESEEAARKYYAENPPPPPPRDLAPAELEKIFADLRLSLGIKQNAEQIEEERKILAAYDRDYNRRNRPNSSALFSRSSIPILTTNNNDNPSLSNRS